MAVHYNAYACKTCVRKYPYSPTDLYLFHRLTRTAYLYNECLAWYNVVITFVLSVSIKHEAAVYMCMKSGFQTVLFESPLQILAVCFIRTFRGRKPL